MSRTIRNGPDWIMLLTIVALLALGIVMVYSASAVSAFHDFGDKYYYVKRQAIFAILGLIAMIVTMRTDYWIWRKWSKVGLWICFGLLAAVLVPGIGVVRGGARSWLGIGSLGIQPSEFMKLGMVLFLANRLAGQGADIHRFIRGFVPPLAIVGLAFGLIMLQPDLGTGAVLVGSSMLLIFAAGAGIKHLMGLVFVGFAGFIGLIVTAPYRLQRITAFLDPWQDPLGAGYQAIQSLYAIGPGQLMGLGLGMSRQKFNYLPEPQTDFIYAIIAEELGFLGGITVLCLFLILIWCGLRTALAIQDRFGRLMAFGITAIVAVQVIINIGVVIGLMPVTGITLPLISAGGSSLTIMLTALGIVLNISKYARWGS
ncbi:MAG: hypothetical protein RLZZ267_1290 [Bacillota bacterium]